MQNNNILRRLTLLFTGLHGLVDEPLQVVVVDFPQRVIVSNVIISSGVRSSLAPSLILVIHLSGLGGEVQRIHGHAADLSGEVLAFIRVRHSGVGGVGGREVCERLEVGR
jgi:hypothetical protein